MRNCVSAAAGAAQLHDYVRGQPAGSGMQEDINAAIKEGYWALTASPNPSARASQTPSPLMPAFGSSQAGPHSNVTLFLPHLFSVGGL